MRHADCHTLNIETFVWVKTSANRIHDEYNGHIYNSLRILMHVDNIQKIILKRYDIPKVKAKKTMLNIYWHKIQKF